ncbi:hypothetical protein VYU27_009094 [Nannochloropsis oceanica]
MLLVKEGRRERGKEEGLLDPGWLKACSEMVVGMGSVACPLLTKIAVVIMGEEGRVGGGGGGGKKKGGRRGTIRLESATMEPASVEGWKDGGTVGGIKLKSVLHSFLAFLKDLEGALNSFASASLSTEERKRREEGREGAGEEEENWLTFVREGDYADLREVVKEDVRASHRLSCERLGRIVKAKREMMNGYTE